MFKWFILHQWKSARRSSIWQKNLALNIFIGFLMLVLLSYIVLLGVLMDQILLELVKDRDPEAVLGGALVYYFLIGFVMRVFMQNIPAMEAVPYMTLTVKRNSISHFLVLKSMTSFFNWLPFFLFLPFSIKWIAAFHGPLSAIVWFLGILFFEWLVNFKLIWFKRKTIAKPQINFILIAAIVFLVMLEKTNWFSLASISEYYFIHLLTQPFWLLLPLAGLIFWYLYNVKYIKKVMYVEDLSPHSKGSFNSSTTFNKLQNYGIIGELILKEVRLLLRNKRSKTVLFLIPFFLLYGMFFYPQEIYLQKPGMLVFVGIFITGGFLMAYGQYIMAWESSHFDFILSSNISVNDYFRAKYFLMVIPTAILYFLTIPYMYYGMEVFWLNLAALFYNIGINTPILLYTASYNKKRMDLSKGAMMNYQGVGVNNFLMVMPLLIIPILIFWPLRLFFGYEMAVLALAGIGIVGIFLHKWFIKFAVHHFEENRYEISEGYRRKY